MGMFVCVSIHVKRRYIKPKYVFIYKIYEEDYKTLYFNYFKTLLLLKTSFLRKNIFKKMKNASNLTHELLKSKYMVVKTLHFNLRCSKKN